MGLFASIVLLISKRGDDLSTLVCCLSLRIQKLISSVSNLKSAKSMCDDSLFELLVSNVLKYRIQSRFELLLCFWETVYNNRVMFGYRIHEINT